MLQYCTPEDCKSVAHDSYGWYVCVCHVMYDLYVCLVCTQVPVVCPGLIFSSAFDPISTSKNLLVFVSLYSPSKSLNFEAE